MGIYTQVYHNHLDPFLQCLQDLKTEQGICPDWIKSILHPPGPITAFS